MSKNHLAKSNYWKKTHHHTIIPNFTTAVAPLLCIHAAHWSVYVPSLWAIAVRLVRRNETAFQTDQLHVSATTECNHFTKSEGHLQSLHEVEENTQLAGDYSNYSTQKITCNHYFTKVFLAWMKLAVSVIVKFYPFANAVYLKSLSAKNTADSIHKIRQKDISHRQQGPLHGSSSLCGIVTVCLRLNPIKLAYDQCWLC